MKYSAVQQFAHLKQQLTQERDSIVARLADINQVLGPVEEISTSMSPRKADENTPQPSRMRGYTPREGSLPARILAEVAKVAGPAKVKDLAAALKKPSMLVSQACVMLRRKRALKRRGRGAYALA